MNAMKRHAVALATGICTAVLLATSPFAAAQQPQSTRAALEGLWSLVSVVNEKDGKKTDAMGPNPPGLFIFDRSGHYAFQLYRAGLQPIASGSRAKGTPEENAAIVAGSLSHFGTYTVDEKAGSFVIRPKASSFPNWTGKDLPRKFEVRGDELKIINPSSTVDPAVSSYLVLTRVK